MKYNVYIEDVSVEAVFNKLGGVGGAKRFLADELLLVEAIVEKVEKVVEEVKIYLKRLFTFTLGAVEEKNLPLPEEVFKSYLDPAFGKCGITFSGTAPETEIAADELVANGKFTDFLGSKAEELERKRLRGCQFLMLCFKHNDRLRGGGWANFVVLTRSDEPVAPDLSNVFVARVRVGADGLSAGLGRVSRVCVWFSGRRPRIFSPQQ
jgi:hypothetical protein